MNVAKTNRSYNYSLNNFKMLYISLTVFLSVALQIIFFLCAEAKELNMAGTNTYYASSSNNQSDWGALTQDYMQKKSISPSNRIPRTFNVKYKKQVAKKQLAKPAVSATNKKKQKEIKPKVYNLATQGKENIYIDAEDNVIKIGDNVRIKGKRETRAFTLNNSKPVHVDQKIFLSKTEIYGAYAEVYSGDDFSFGVGPEYTHSVTVGADRDDSSNDSDLSLGFQLMIGF